MKYSKIDIIDLKGKNYKINGKTVDSITVKSYPVITAKLADGLLVDFVGVDEVLACQNGTAQHPLISKKPVNGFILERQVYECDGETYYECSHPDWDEPQILSVSEINSFRNDNDYVEE